MDDFSQDPSLLQDYLAECNELLEQLDRDLVDLEHKGSDSELLNRVFRAVHTIKGTSGFMGFQQVVDLTHEGEDLLNLLRKGERLISPAVTDVLLNLLDLLRAMMLSIAAGGLQVFDIAPVVARLRELQQAAPAPASTAPSAPAPRPAPETSEAGSPVREPEEPAHAAEAEASRTIRVDVNKLDDLINMVGELVLERNRLLQLSRELDLQDKDGKYKALDECAQRLSFITGELQAASLRTRMVPVETVLRRFPRLVRDLAKALGKNVALQIEGEDTELDKNIAEQIGDPLLHLVRNALDHGIESPGERAAAGKNVQGTLTIRAMQLGDYIELAIIDDGRGMDTERIVRKAVEKGLVTAERVRGMQRSEILDLIFVAGFSTAEKVSDLSGRGVGMDVVRANLKKLNGVVEVESELGQGSRIRLKLPLTLAIMPVLLVESRPEIYGLPLRAVQEVLRVPANQIHAVEGVEVFRRRDRVIPLQHLAKFVGRNGGARPEMLEIVVLAVGERRVGLVVDQTLGQEETVIKSLGSYLAHYDGLAGATIGGDGQVRLILDPAEIAGVGETLQAN